MPYSIMLDAGHGGSDPGATYYGRREKDDTLRLTLAIGEILQNNGIDVEYTRTTDVYETPYQKAMEANNAGVDFFVSIHRNSFPTDNEVSGVETLVYDLSGIKYEMAQNMAPSIQRHAHPSPCWLQGIFPPRFRRSVSQDLLLLLPRLFRPFRRNQGNCSCHGCLSHN